MNVPEYRKGVRMAQERFEKALAVAAEELQQELRSLDEQFFDDNQPAEWEMDLLRAQERRAERHHRNQERD